MAKRPRSPSFPLNCPRLVMKARAFFHSTASRAPSPMAAPPNWPTLHSAADQQDASPTNTQNPPAKGNNPMPNVLSSWKEIASYVGRSIRTVQRWERELGLPVHRPTGKSDGVVIALPSELDAWVLAMPTQSHFLNGDGHADGHSNGNGRSNGNGNGNGHAAEILRQAVSKTGTDAPAASRSERLQLRSVPR